MGISIEGNGLELWRKLFSEFEGSDKLIQIAGRTRLQDYPQRKAMKDLNHHIDDWLHQFYQYGDGISKEHAKTMCVRTIPESLRVEIYRRPEVEALDLLKLTDWVRHQSLYQRSEELVAQHVKSERITALERQSIAALPAREPQPRAAPRGRPPPRGDPKGGRRRAQTPPKQRAALDPLARESKGCVHRGAADHARVPNAKLDLSRVQGI